MTEPPPADNALSALAHRVVEWDLEELPSHWFERAGDVVIDCLAAALCGAGDPASRAARAVARESFGAGPDAVWFSRHRAPPAAAVLANATAASILDLDDGHRAAAGHPGAAIVPAVLAEAARREHTPREVARALLVGYEVAVRLAAGRDLAALDTVASGRWTHFGVVAALARLRGATPTTLTQALAIAGVHGPNLSASGYSRVMASHTKEGIPWSAVNAVLALALAEAGYTGPTDLLDDPRYYNAQRILDGLGEAPRLLGTYFKPYACCRWAHAPIEALTLLMQTHSIAAEDIRAITVGTFSRALTLANSPTPGTLPAAQFSLPFCIALAAVHGPEALAPLRSGSLRDPAVLDLAQRVRLTVDPECDAAFPVEAGTLLRIECRDSTQTLRIRRPRGEPDNPMTRSDLLQKLETVNAGKPLATVRAALEHYLGSPDDRLAPTRLAAALCEPGLADPDGDRSQAPPSAVARGLVER